MRVVGTLVLAHTGLAVHVSPKGAPPPPHSGPYPTEPPLIIPVRQGADDHEAGIGLPVIVVGLWDDYGIADAVITRQVEDPQVPRPRPVGETSPIPAASWTGEAIDAFSPLMDDGALLGVWRAPDGHVQAVATEPDSVRRALVAIHGETVEVIASRWAREDYAAAQRLSDLAEQRKLLAGIGQNATPDGYEGVWMCLAWVTDELAAAAEGIPDGMLDVELLVTPA